MNWGICFLNRCVCVCSVLYYARVAIVAVSIFLSPLFFMCACVEKDQEPVPSLKSNHVVVLIWREKMKGEAQTLRGGNK